MLRVMCVAIVGAAGLSAGAQVRVNPGGTPAQDQPVVIPGGPGGTPVIRSSGQPVVVPGGERATPGEPVNPAPAGWWDDRPPQVGDEAPPLSFETIYDRPSSIPDPASFSWSQYAGRVVVVDFSTSWCGPCRMMVPHMNELVDALSDEPVVFITVSNESQERVNQFRTDVEFRSLVARDVDGSTFEDYWVNGVPHVAIIETAGRIAGLTHPAAVSADQLRALARGQSVEFARMNESPVRMTWNDAARSASLAPEGLEESLAFAVLTPVDARGMSFRTNQNTGEISADGAAAASILAYALDLNARMIDLRAPLPTGTFYRVAVRPGDGNPQTARRMLLSMVESALGLKVTITNEPGEVRVLRVKDPALLPPLAEAGGPRAGSMSPGTIDMPSMSLAMLARHLSNFTPVPLIDETGLSTQHRVRLTYDPTVRGSLTDALASIGLELAEAQRPVRRAIVERALD